MGNLKAPIKYPGAKWSIAEWICNKFPPHRVYLEPFFGSGAVFFNKKPCRYETINDLDDRVVNFFTACRDHPQELARVINLTPWSRTEFMEIQEKHGGENIELSGEPVEDARRFAVRCCQSFGQKLSCRAGWKNTKVSTGLNGPKWWGEIPANLIEIAKRLKDAQIECTPAEKLIPLYNTEECLLYIDPPYPRMTRSGSLYFKEMTELDQHEHLLQIVKKHKGPVVVSGYGNELYDTMLSKWYRFTTNYVNNAAEQETEVLWTNYEPVEMCELEFDWEEDK